MLMIEDVEYEKHPAFAECQFSDDPALSALARDFERAILKAEAATRHPHVTPELVIREAIAPAFTAFFNRLREVGRNVEDFDVFVDDLMRELTHVLEGDISIATRQATYVHRPMDGRVRVIHDGLRERGYWVGAFGPEVVELLRAAMAPFTAELLRRYQQEGRRDRDSLSMNQWPQEVLQTMGRVFNAPEVINALSNYKCNNLVFTGAAYELSVPETVWWRGRYGEGIDSLVTAYFHLDQTIRNPKMLFYLTDVDSENGATTVAPTQFSRLKSLFGRSLDSVQFGDCRRSSPNNSLLGHPKARKAFAKLPKEVRAMGHFGNDILAGSPQERVVADTMTQVVGPAGTCVVFDGGCVAHKGGVVTSGHRLAFQVIYSPIG